jgi:TPR repeat protein
MHAYGAALADGRGGPSDFVDGLAWLYAAGAAGADDAAVKAARFLAARLTARDIRRAHRKGKAIARRVKRQHPPRFDGRPALDAFLPAPASGVDKPGRH